MKTETGHGKVKKTKKKRKAPLRLLILVLIILLSLICGKISYDYVMNSYKASVDSEASVNIKPEDGISIDIPLGSSTQDIADILKDKGIIKRTDFFKLVSKINGYDGLYKSGTHVIEKGVDYNSLKGYETLMQIFSSMPLENPSITVMIPEGLTFNQIADILYDKKLIDKDKFKTAANEGEFDYKFMKGIPADREYKLQGYLFPETYKFDAKGGEKEIINKLLGQFNKVFQTEYYTRAEELGMSVDEIIILASIIEREAKVPEERETIAGVFYNRLKSKDASLHYLQSCATLQYIMLERDGKVKDTITKEDEEIDNPFNTYKYTGLPPGPICSPGRDSIVAALSPEDHNYYYFVAKNDGTGEHYFSKTYNEQLAAKAKSDQNKKKQQ